MIKINSDPPFRHYHVALEWNVVLMAFLCIMDNMIISSIMFFNHWLLFSFALITKWEAFDLINELTGGTKPEECAMFGDRIDTDIQFGKNCGLKTVLTLTGKFYGKAGCVFPMPFRPGRRTSPY